MDNLKEEWINNKKEVGFPVR